MRMRTVQKGHHKYVEHFSKENFHFSLKTKGGRAVGMYDELNVLFDQLDRGNPE